LVTKIHSALGGFVPEQHWGGG